MMVDKNGFPLSIGDIVKYSNRFSGMDEYYLIYKIDISEIPFFIRVKEISTGISNGLYPEICQFYSKSSKLLRLVL